MFTNTDNEEITMAKRPLLTIEDRNRLRIMADKARRQLGEDGLNRAYAAGVVDVLDWLASNDDPSPLLKDITR